MEHPVYKINTINTFYATWIIRVGSWTAFLTCSMYSCSATWYSNTVSTNLCQTYRIASNGLIVARKETLSGFQYTALLSSKSCKVSVKITLLQTQGDNNQTPMTTSQNQSHRSTLFHRKPCDTPRLPKFAKKRSLFHATKQKITISMSTKTLTRDLWKKNGEEHRVLCYENGSVTEEEEEQNNWKKMSGSWLLFAGVA